MAPGPQTNQQLLSIVAKPCQDAVGQWQRSGGGDATAVAIELINKLLDVSSKDQGAREILLLVVGLERALTVIWGEKSALWDRASKLEKSVDPTVALTTGFRAIFDRTLTDHGQILTLFGQKRQIIDFAIRYLDEGAQRNVAGAAKIGATVEAMRIPLWYALDASKHTDPFAPLAALSKKVGEIAAEMPQKDLPLLREYVVQSMLQHTVENGDPYLMLLVQAISKGGLDVLISDIERFPLLRDPIGKQISQILGDEYIFSLSPDRVIHLRKLIRTPHGPAQCISSAEIAKNCPAPMKPRVFEALTGNQEFYTFCSKVLLHGMELGAAELANYLTLRIDSPTRFAAMEQLAQEDKNRYASAIGEIVRCGYDVLADSTVCHELLEIVQQRPQLAQRMIKLWRSVYSEGSLNKLKLVDYVYRDPMFTEGAFQNFKAALEALNDAQVPKEAGGRSLQGLLKELRRAAKVTNAQSSAGGSSTKIAPFDLLVRGIDGEEHPAIAALLAEAKNGPVLLRRGLVFIQQHARPEDRLELFSIVANGGNDTRRALTTIMEHREFRERFGTFLYSRHTKAAERILTTATNELNRVDVVREVLFRPPIQDGSTTQTEEVIAPAKNFGLLFGEWRGKERVLIAGGEYTGPAADLINGAVPNLDISILDRVEKKEGRGVLARHFDVVILISQSVAHSMADKAKENAESNDAVFYAFHNRSPGLIADLLRWAYGVLEPTEESQQP